MSARLPSRWLFAAALLAAEGFTSAAVAQSPDPLADPPVRPAPQTTPVPAPTHVLPARLYVEPLLLEEEQVSEHSEPRPAAPPIVLAPPRVFRSCGLPECDEDDGTMAPEEVTLRCLLFSINPLAAFLPLRVEVGTEALPSPAYLQHPPQYIPPEPELPRPQISAPAPQYIPPPPRFPLAREEVERLEVMPIEVERLDVMPIEEESEPQYQLLAPWIDYTRLFKLSAWPLAEIQVSVRETQTGALLFGVGAEVSRTGTITVTAEPLSETKPAPACPSGPERRIPIVMNQSEHFGPIGYDPDPSQVVDPPSHPMPERVLGGVGCDDEESVHDLLAKCRRELSRGHYAAAEDLAQQAIERDREQVAADPLVRDSDLLLRVKAIASLPLGTVDPCAAKGAGGGIVPAGAAKAIGSDERIVEALLQEFNTAYQQGKYREAEVLAESARNLDPDNAAAVAALKLATLQMSLPQHSGPAGRIVATLTVQSRNDFKEGRYEEARNAALQALSVVPGDPTALALVRLAAEALARQSRPEPVPQCTYVGTNVRPILPPVDPAVVGALQKILIEGDKGGPFGGTEEAEPKDDGSKPAPRR